MKQAHVLNEMMVHIVNFTSDKGFSFFLCCFDPATVTLSKYNIARGCLGLKLIKYNLSEHFIAMKI